MKIKLPALSISRRIGKRSKTNIVKHLIQEEMLIDCKIITQEHTNVILQDVNGIEYFITSKIENIPSNYNYVLQTHSFTINDLNNGTLKFQKWIKHPKLRIYSPSEILMSWKDTFNFKEEDLENDIIGLRTPQLGAIHSILGYLTSASDIATVVLPTGTGKTETMLSILISKRCNKLLVIVPSDPLRTQLSKKFYDLGLLKQKDINGDCIVSSTAKYPIVGVLNTSFHNIKELEAFFENCNVIVTTMNLVSNSPKEQQIKIAELCSHLFIDEAHHSKAGNWDNFIKNFDRKKVLQYTATPYRNDGQLLDGKIIYNFTLREAQEQGYFKTINFFPIREYDINDADIEIAKRAVDILRQDINAGYEHILMARCNDKNRAEKVFKIYEQYSEYNPVLIHSTINNKNKIKEKIINKEHKIIVCVDMLGEGFDLPELKIAAFHDIRKSLPITLQFAGRFTRTSRDSKLGNASFIANLYQPQIDDELSLLYVKESNWNTILPKLSQQATQDQIDLNDFLSGFEYIEEAIIPYQEIKPAFSTVVYKKQNQTWHASDFCREKKGFENYDYSFCDLNKIKNILIILLGNKKKVEWGNFKDIYNIDWSIFIIYWQQKNNLLFINSSENMGNYKELAKIISGENVNIIKDENVFKSFYNIDRVKLFNVGLRKGLGKNITFQSYYGKGVQEALSITEEKSGINNNVFGVGFKDGEIASMGCSRKGRIWSYSRGTINQFIDWCNEIGDKLSNQNINPNILLKNAIKPLKIAKRPAVFPLTVDWNHDLYKETEENITFTLNGKSYDLSNSELNILNPTIDNDLEFAFNTFDNESINFTQELTAENLNGENVYNYKIKKTSTVNAIVKIGKTVYEKIEEFFNDYAPIFWFADGSTLQGYEHIIYNEDILLYPKDNITNWVWNGVNLGEESEKFENIRKTSIQHYCFQKLLSKDYDILYNDDDSGEIADIITIKNLPKKIEIELYHLKYALKGKISNEIKNFYELCGQAQKSIIWVHKEGREFINHLIKRECKKNKLNLTRLKKGTISDLEQLLHVVKRTKPIVFNIFIVQPGLSKKNASDEILNLLSVTANHIKKEGNIDLRIISSD